MFRGEGASLVEPFSLPSRFFFFVCSVKCGNEDEAWLTCAPAAGCRASSGSDGRLDVVEAGHVETSPIGQRVYLR